MYKKLNLSACGVQEMETEDMKKVNGGFGIEKVAAIVALVLFVKDVYDNKDEIANGFKEGYKAGSN